MSPKIPESLKLEHEELHADLVRATKAGGPIGLLSALARGEVDKEMRSVLAMTDRLKTELPEMLESTKQLWRR